MSFALKCLSSLLLRDIFIEIWNIQSEFAKIIFMVVQKYFNYGINCSFIIIFFNLFVIITDVHLEKYFFIMIVYMFNVIFTLILKRW